MNKIRVFRIAAALLVVSVSPVQAFLENGNCIMVFFEKSNKIFNANNNQHIIFVNLKNKTILN